MLSVRHAVSKRPTLNLKKTREPVILIPIISTVSGSTVQGRSYYKQKTKALKKFELNKNYLLCIFFKSLCTMWQIQHTKKNQLLKKKTPKKSSQNSSTKKSSYKTLLAEKNSLKKSTPQKIFKMSSTSLKKIYSFFITNFPQANRLQTFHFQKTKTY